MCTVHTPVTLVIINLFRSSLRSMQSHLLSRLSTSSKISVECLAFFQRSTVIGTSTTIRPVLRSVVCVKIIFVFKFLLHRITYGAHYVRKGISWEGMRIGNIFYSVFVRSVYDSAIIQNPVDRLLFAFRDSRIERNANRVDRLFIEYRYFRRRDSELHILILR